LNITVLMTVPIGKQVQRAASQSLTNIHSAFFITCGLPRVARTRRRIQLTEQRKGNNRLDVSIIPNEKHPLLAQHEGEVRTWEPRHESSRRAHSPRPSVLLPQLARRRALTIPAAPATTSVFVRSRLDTADPTNVPIAGECGTESCGLRLKVTFFRAEAADRGPKCPVVLLWHAVLLTFCLFRLP